MELTLALIGLSVFFFYLLVSGFMGDVSYHFSARSLCLIDKAVDYEINKELESSCLKQAGETTRLIARALWGLFFLVSILLFIIAQIWSAGIFLTDSIAYLFKK